MEVSLEHPAGEIKRLQRCVNDLISVLALPVMWSGSEPSRVVQMLLDSLLCMLDLDLVYARLNYRVGESPVETVRVAPSRKLMATPQEIGEMLNHWSGDDPLKWPALMRNLIADSDLSIMPLPLGLQGEIGVIVAGSQRADFPRETERLVLSVAANQAAIGLQEARLLSEQKRVANELDRRVGQRTTELAAANEELRLQVALLQRIPVAAWTVGPDGTPDFVNQSWLEYTGQALDYVQSHPEAWMTAMHPEDRERASRSFWHGIRSGQGFTMEARFRRAHDGTYRWHLNRAVALRDAEGKILRFVGTSTDIEDLKRAVGKNQTLLEISNAIVANLSQDTLMRAVSEALHHIVEFDHAVLALYVPGKDVFRLLEVDSRLLSEFFRPGLELDRRANSVGWVFEHQEPLVRGNLLEEQEYSNERILAAEGVKSEIIVPLIVRGQCVGALAIASRTSNLYTQADADFLREVANQVSLAVENMKSYEEISALKIQLEKENVYLREEISKEHNFANFAQIIGNSTSLRRVLKQVEIVAPTDSTVLIYGETGTGKELIARAIHDLNPRRAKPFVKLNCAAIPTGLLESELFGHEKGAFTGAIAQRIGRFEVANGGTIFLDEIGEIPLELQTKLLRVLQEREFERLGSSRTLRTDARLIAATNRDLEAMVGEQKFRSDLFFRLNVFPVLVPPLRERQGDIPLLVRHFTQQFSRRMNKVIETIPSAAMDALCRYQWPGNIRELQNVVERAVIVSPGPALSVDIAGLKFPKSGPRVEEVLSAKSTNNALLGVLEETERQHILGALQQSNWVVAGPNGAAVRLGMKRSTLQKRMRKLTISRRFA